MNMDMAASQFLCKSSSVLWDELRDTHQTAILTGHDFGLDPDKDMAFDKFVFLSVDLELSMGNDGVLYPNEFAAVAMGQVNFEVTTQDRGQLAKDMTKAKALPMIEALCANNAVVLVMYSGMTLDMLMYLEWFGAEAKAKNLFIVEAFSVARLAMSMGIISPKTMSLTDVAKAWGVSTHLSYSRVMGKHKAKDDAATLDSIMAKILSSHPDLLKGMIMPWASCVSWYKSMAKAKF